MTEFLRSASAGQSQFARAIRVFVSIPDEQLHALVFVAAILKIGIGFVSEVRGVPNIDDMLSFSIAINTLCVVASPPVTIV